MRSATILEAYRRAVQDTLYEREWRQVDTFKGELLRRLDERDDLRERNAFLLASAEAAQAQLAECRAELATARAFISSVVDAPKDYPAEVSA